MVPGHIVWIACLAFLFGAAVANPLVFSNRRPLAPRLQGDGRRLRGKFLHISDFHPDEFYRPLTSTADDTACHRSRGDAGFYGAEATDCDSPFALVNETLRWVRDHVGDDIDFVLWTGDSARHDSDEETPRRSDEVLRTNRWMADRMAETFASPEGGLAIPVVPALGNNDFLPHNIFLPGPNRYLTQYLDIWRHFIPEEQRHSFLFGGWFYVEVIPDQLAIFSLNTMYFFDRNAGVDGCAAASEPGYQHLEWLRIQLQVIRDRGMKAILMGHVPPARTRNKRLWDETCWQKYTLWLRQYRDVVAASLYGHMNIDHFVLADTEDIEPGLGDRGYGEPASARRSGGGGGGGGNDGGHISIRSKGDYLYDLRDDWSRLAKPLPKPDENEVRRAGHHDHDSGWGERYQLAMVGPSIVPNYYPSLRVYEYSLSGLEDSPAWRDDPDKSVQGSDISKGPEEPGDNVENENEDEDEDEDLRPDLKRDTVSADSREEHETKDKKKKKKPRPHDPHLVIPSPPSKSAPPGPAYSVQALTLMGYTQYFANLTRLNNMTSSAVDHHHHDRGPLPLPFEYEVEYSTATDKWYRLADLTVGSYVELARRIARSGTKSHEAAQILRYYDDDDDEDDNDDDEKSVEVDGCDADCDDDYEPEMDEDEDGVAEEGKKRKKKKKHKKKANKVWFRFLSRAFVSAIPKKELKKWVD